MNPPAITAAAHCLTLRLESTRRPTGLFRPATVSGLRCMLVLVFATLGVSAGEPPAGPGWKAGAASVDITPDGPVWMAGYGFRNRPSEGVEQRLFAKALAIEDNTGGQMVFVTLDLIGVPFQLREFVEREVAARHRLSPDSVLLNASHTHSGPSPYGAGGPGPEGQAKSDAYGRFLEERILTAISTAMDRRAPAELAYVRARAGFAMNRRLPVGTEIRNSPHPDGPVDHDVPVLRVSDADGKIKALMFGYACHNTVTGLYVLNGDYAGYAQAFLEEAHPGAVALFMTGAGGDQNPYPRGRLDLTVQHGRALANAVEAALAVVNPRQLQGPLRSAYGLAELEFAETSREDLQRRARSRNTSERTRAEAHLKRVDAGDTLPRSHPCPVQVVRFGTGLTLIAIAGETTVDYSLRLKRELGNGPAAVWVAGYSNEGLGYLGSRRVIVEGGYEGRSANLGRHPGPWAVSTEERVIEKAYDLLRATNQ